MTDESRERLTRAFADGSFPINPIPFAQGLADMVKADGTDSIKTDDCKRVLWVLIAQSYGQLATVSLHDEWGRLYSLLPESDPNEGATICSTCERKL